MKTTNKTKESSAEARPDTDGQTGMKATGPESADGEKKEESKGAHDQRLGRVASAIDDAIDNIREKLTSEDLRASVSDLVRLIQLRKELTDDAPRQVTVRWVEEWNSSPANDE
jgi:hypothetical protein